MNALYHLIKEKPKIKVAIAKSWECIEITNIWEDEISVKIRKYINHLPNYFPNAKSWILKISCQNFSLKDNFDENEDKLNFADLLWDTFDEIKIKTISVNMEIISENDWILTQSNAIVCFKKGSLAHMIRVK